MGGKRCAGVGRLLVPIALFGALPAAAQDQSAAPPDAKPSPTIIVLDSSHSMWARLDGQSKMALLRSGLGQAFSDYKDRIAFGLVAYGHRAAGASCADGQLLAKPGDLTSATQGKLLFGFKPTASKPIAAALAEAAKGVPSGSLDIVLITDGPDSCKADVCATATGLKQGAPALRIHVIDFDPKAKQTLKSLKCVAENTGGLFLPATHAAELKQSLTAVLDAVTKPPAPAAPVVGIAPMAPPSGPASKPVGGDPQITPSSAAPPPDAPTQSTQAKANPPLSDTPPGPGAPGQTDMPKSAAVSPTQSAPPAATGIGALPQASPKPAGPSLPVPVTFKALLTEGGAKVQSGLIWRVFSTEVGPHGTRKLVSTHREAMPTAALLPGEYLVNAAYGLSNLTKKIKVESGQSLEETFVLNTGGLKLAAVQANGNPLPKTSVHFDILSDEEDQFGNRHKILDDAKPGVIIRLNAGAYHIVSTYGDANATVRADVTVEPGKVTEATVKHAAAPITFRLVQTSGGEALADTKWSILTKTGDVLKEIAGALPTHILAAGDYAVVAKHNGESYMTKFNVAAGEAKQIEVVMDQGPTSPEALKAITDPPPPPAPTDATTAGPGAPAAPDSGMAFGGGEPATPREPGLFPNPGALLRPRLP